MAVVVRVAVVGRLVVGALADLVRDVDLAAVALPGDDFAVALVAVDFGVDFVTARFAGAFVAAVFAGGLDAVALGAAFFETDRLLSAGVAFGADFGTGRARVAPFFAGGRAVPVVLLLREAGVVACGVDFFGGAVAAAAERLARTLLGGGVASTSALATSAPFQPRLLGESARSGSRMVRIDRRTCPL